MAAYPTGYSAGAASLPQVLQLACKRPVTHSAKRAISETSMLFLDTQASAIHWRPLNTVAMPAQSRAWILQQGSLTRALQGLGDFRVRRLQQSYSHPTATEQQLLALPLRRWALIREVLLLVDDQPVAFARSVIPIGSLRGRNRILGHMANRSLGAELFRSPEARRQVVLEAAISPGLLPSGLSEIPCYGRQSLFLKRGKPLLVAEIFLPALTQAFHNPPGKA